MDRVEIGIFAEDSAHIRFLSAMIGRLASDVGVAVDLRVYSGRGGAPVMQFELSKYLRLARRGESTIYDILIVMQDANRRGFSSIFGELRGILENAGYPGTYALAVPDPYVEAWYLADPQSLQTLLSAAQALRNPGRGRKDRQYKSELRRVFEESGRDASSDNSGFALEIVSIMNLYRAGRNVPSLGNFINELRSALNQFA